MFDLRAWLRRTPKPRKLRLVVDDTERIVDLGKGQRVRWAEVEETVTNAGPSLIECLDEKGEIIRSHILEEEESKADKQLAEDRSAMRVQAGQAAVLDAYGRRLVEAFEAGSEASSAMQKELMGMLTDLSGHFTAAIANMHTMSVNLASLIQANAELAGGAEGDETKSDKVLGLLTAMIGNRSSAPAAQPASVANGTKKGSA